MDISEQRDTVIHLFNPLGDQHNFQAVANSQEDEPKLLLDENLSEGEVAALQSAIIERYKTSKIINLTCLHKSKKQKKTGTKLVRNKRYITVCYDTADHKLHELLQGSIRWRITEGEKVGELVFKMESTIPNKPYEISVNGLSPSPQLFRALFDEIARQEPFIAMRLRNMGIKHNNIGFVNEYITDRIFMQSCMRVMPKGTLLQVGSPEQEGELQAVYNICLDRARYYADRSRINPVAYAVRNEVEFEVVRADNEDPFENGSAGSSSPDLPAPARKATEEALLIETHAALPLEYRHLLTRTLDNKAQCGISRLPKKVVGVVPEAAFKRA